MKRALEVTLNYQLVNCPECPPIISEFNCLHFQLQKAKKRQKRLLTLYALGLRSERKKFDNVSLKINSTSKTQNVFRLLVVFAIIISPYRVNKLIKRTGLIK